MVELHHDPRPHSRLTPRVRRDVFADRAAFRLVAGRAERPGPEEVARIGDEAAEALDLFRARGWDDDPASYHRTPPAPTGVRTRSARSGNLRFTMLTWPDGYECRPGEPGAWRYAGYTSNRVARAAVLEHRTGDRPWLVCVHGFGMGSPALDLRVFRALHLFTDLGLNVALLTLPFHGRRKPGRGMLPPMPSADLLDTLHGLEQSVWDVRQLLQHVRSRTSQPIGLMGLSLGGLVSGVVASLEDDLRAAILLVPAVDLPTLMTDAGGNIDDAALAAGLIEVALPLLGPVSPMRLAPRVPHDGRLIVAGTLDRFARPTTQAVALWRHWGEPSLHWYHGGHVSLFWARGVQDAIDGHLRSVGLSAEKG